MGNAGNAGNVGRVLKHSYCFNIFVNFELVERFYFIQSMISELVLVNRTRVTLICAMVLRDGSYSVDHSLRPRGGGQPVPSLLLASSVCLSPSGFAKRFNST